MSNQLGLVFFPAFDWAISPTHPEREERLLYTRDQIVEEGLLDVPGIKEYKPRLATARDIERVHIPVPSLEKLIKEAHLVSAGGAITAAEAVMRREVASGFALVRPPGHHAMRVVHGTRGFCTVNIEAITIEYLRKHYGIKRVAVVDTDVHHGDGTQDIFYHDPDTLFISFHQDGRTLYPGTGFPEEIGSPVAFGSTVNLPLPPGTGDEGLHYVYDNLIARMLEDFKPDFVINSAGQDNHYSDPLASMSITAQGYARLAQKLKADLAVLEGGYSIEQALPYVNVGIILAMAGMEYSKVIEPDIHTLTETNNGAYIKKLVKDWREIWEARDELKKRAIIKANGVWERQRGIYYDDSGISEHQQEAYYLCSKCRGYMTVATHAESHNIYNTAFIGILWTGSCPACRQAVKNKVWQAKKMKEYEYYYLQDQENDTLEQL